MLRKLRNIDIISLIVLLGLTLLVIYGIILQIDSVSGISASSHKRTALISTTESVEEYYDISPEWTDNLDYIDAVMPAFAANTGVIPFLKVFNPDEITDADELQEMADYMYGDKFSDENHFLFLFVPSAGNNYISACSIGNNAKTVMDEEAVTIFYQYLDKFIKNPECSHADLFLRTYRGCYERIMGISSNGIAYTVVLCIITVLLIAVLIWRVTRILKRVNS